MNNVKVETLNAIVGVILLFFSITFFLLVMYDEDAFIVLFNFNIDYNASNLGEAIAAAAAGLGAAIAFFMFALIIGGLYFLFCIIIAFFTFVGRRTKFITILLFILTGLSLIIEIRAIAFLAKAGLTSIILIIHLIGDIVIIAICCYNIFLFIRKPNEIV